ncbi:peptidylprolyl isomerase [Edaphobacter flagellatus]|uniref:peptidylprolyl isomerase n=1 Tax=Edaphobacter flagellatus TaxID=1933044 RepID=UPI0021B355D2|nr:peptidylprolyl isomerase [Edaphobacter flagellatus]
MIFRISQFRAVRGLSLLALPVAVLAQAPRYQSPLAVPNAPQQQVTLPTPPAITPNGVVVEDVIVRVNDQIINRSDLERSEQQLTTENQQNQASPQEVADRQKNLLRDMIDQQLLLSRAKELGLNADAEVIRRLDDIRKQNHLDSMEDLEKAARQQGVSFEDFKANIRNNILTQQVVRDEVGRHIQPTQGQEQAYYNAHKNEFAQPEQVRLSEILVPTPADATDAVVAQAQAKAEGIAAKIKSGDDFAALAKANSGGPTASQGGDLGLFKRGALAKVLEDQTFSLPAGGVTAPIRTRQGFVILKVTEHQEAGVPALKDIEPQIQEAIYMQAMQPALREYLTKLREDAYIDIKPGFVDSGASPRQTKPVFSAYAPPVPKKKQAQEKQRFDRGGRFSTVAKNTPAAPAPKAALPAASAPAAGTADAATAGAATPDVAAADVPSTPPAATKVSSKPSKPKKIKREKIRFGQAPRNALPPGPQETAVGAGAGTASSTQAAVGDAGSAIAPGTAIAPTESTTQVLTSSADADPLAPKPTNTGKTRYSYRAKTEAIDKAARKDAVVKQKAAFTPSPETTQEKADKSAQATPLGLNGDTATKKKKKRAKGEPKERLQNKPTAPTTDAPAPDPTVNPNLGATPAGITPKPVPAPQTTTPQQNPPAPAPQPNN